MKDLNKQNIDELKRYANSLIISGIVGLVGSVILLIIVIINLLN